MHFYYFFIPLRSAKYVYLYVCRHAHSFHTYRYRYLTSYVAVYPAAQALYTINLNREHISKPKCLNSTKFSTHNQQVCVHLATYACPPPHAAAAAIDRYVLPTGPTAANPPHGWGGLACAAAVCFYVCMHVFYVF